MTLAPYSDQEDLRRLGRARLGAILLDDTRFGRFLAWLDNGLQAPKHTRVAMVAARMFYNACKEAGVGREANQRIYVELGVKDESDARRYIELGKRLEAARNDASMTLERYHTEALEIMEICHQQQPELREIARARIR